MIILEGPDGSGKSTLIANLERYDLKHLKALRGGVGGSTKAGWAEPVETPMLAYRRQIAVAKQQSLRTGRETAFDRFHLSEHVYGPLLRDRQDVPEFALYQIQTMLREQEVPVILCLPPFEQTLKNVEAPGRERPGYQTLDFLRKAYDRFVEMSIHATLVYDYTVDPVPVIHVAR